MVIGVVRDDVDSGPKLLRICDGFSESAARQLNQCTGNTEACYMLQQLNRGVAKQSAF